MYNELYRAYSGALTISKCLDVFRKATEIFLDQENSDPQTDDMLETIEAALRFVEPLEQNEDLFCETAANWTIGLADFYIGNLIDMQRLLEKTSEVLREERTTLIQIQSFFNDCEKAKENASQNAIPTS